MLRFPKMTEALTTAAGTTMEEVAEVIVLAEGLKKEVSLLEVEEVHEGKLLRDARHAGLTLAQAQEKEGQGAANTKYFT